jgi:hypothetical protein
MEIEHLRAYLYQQPLVDWLNLYGNVWNLDKKNVCSLNLKRTFLNLHDFLDLQDAVYGKSIEYTREAILQRKSIIWNPHILVEGIKFSTYTSALVRRDCIKICFPELEGFSFSEYIWVDVTARSGDILKSGFFSTSYKCQMDRARTYLLRLYISQTLNVLPAEGEIIGLIMNSRLEKGLISWKASDTILKSCFNAHEWVLSLASEGRQWNPFKPLRIEMMPNMKRQHISPEWGKCIEKVSIENEEPTLIPGISYKMRNTLFKQGRTRYTKLLHLDNLSKLSKKFMWINDPRNIQEISPRKIKKSVNVTKIHNIPDTYFCVDFETLNEGGHTWIFMIGCAVHQSGRQPIYHQWTLLNLLYSEQKNILLEWVKWMESFVEDRLDKYPLFHWSQAEPSVLSKWKHVHVILELLNWSDLMKIFKTEPIVIKGCFNFRLKDVCKALNRFGHVKKLWSGEISDGLQASMLAQDYYTSNSSKTRGNFNGLNNICKYNLLDVEVLVDIVIFLRKRV